MFCLHTRKLTLSSIFDANNSKYDDTFETPKRPLTTPSTSPPKRIRLVEKTQVLGTNLTLKELQDVLHKGRLSNSEIDYDTLSFTLTADVQFGPLVFSTSDPFDDGDSFATAAAATTAMNVSNYCGMADQLY